MLDLIICLMAFKLIYELKSIRIQVRILCVFMAMSTYLLFRMYTGKFIDYLISQKVYHGLGSIEARYLGMALGALAVFGGYKLMHSRAKKMK